MFNFLHTFKPQPILISLGPVNIYWYGLFLVLAILAALYVTSRLAKRENIPSQLVFDLAFWLIVWGIIGARIYDILLELPYYLQHPLQTLEIWRGGLAIHGAVIAGLIVVWQFSRQKKINFWRLTSLIVPGLVFGQAIGRWGNYFNQELFGKPTSQAWGIPINLINRPAEYAGYQYFQPTFLYESLGCLAIFLILILASAYFRRIKKKLAAPEVWSVASYMILYSILRFSLEFIRIDYAPAALGLRWPQIISLIIIISFIIILIFKNHAAQKKSENS